MKLLYKDAIPNCFKPPEARAKKLEEWVKQAEKARISNNLEAYPNQYDEAEELITFYTFAPVITDKL